MINLISVILGVVSLVVALVGLVPGLGWLNWAALGISVVGLVLGILSSRRSGRDINLVVFILAIFRLFMGGGIF